MKIDETLARLPFVGIIFQKSYAFWRNNIAIANVTHVLLGIGIAFLVLAQFTSYGIVLVAIAVVMHVVALVKGKI